MPKHALDHKLLLLSVVIGTVEVVIWGVFGRAFFKHDWFSFRSWLFGKINKNHLHTHTHTQTWGELLLSVHLAINDAWKIHARNFLQRKLRPRNIMIIMIIIILLTVISVSIIARLFLDYLNILLLIFTWLAFFQLTQLNLFLSISWSS